MAETHYVCQYIIILLAGLIPICAVARQSCPTIKNGYLRVLCRPFCLQPRYYGLPSLLKFDGPTSPGAKYEKYGFSENRKVQNPPEWWVFLLTVSTQLGQGDEEADKAYLVQLEVLWQLVVWAATSEKTLQGINTGFEKLNNAATNLRIAEPATPPYEPRPQPVIRYQWMILHQALQSKSDGDPITYAGIACIFDAVAWPHACHFPGCLHEWATIDAILGKADRASAKGGRGFCSLAAARAGSVAFA